MKADAAFDVLHRDQRRLREDGLSSVDVARREEAAVVDGRRAHAHVVLAADDVLQRELVRGDAANRTG